MKFSYLFIITAIIILSCGDEKTNIDYIDVRYIPSEITPLLPFQCSMMDGEWDEILKTEINNEKFLIEFEKVYNKLYDYKDTIPLDVRIKLIIHLKNNHIDTLCTGKYFGIIKNGVIQKNDKDFIEFVKKEIDY
jgi:hypothetical protein